MSDKIIQKSKFKNKPHKILVVDDQPLIRELLALTLGDEDTQIYQANDCRSALAMIKAIKPDLILLDVMLPGEFDGLEVCRRIKSDNKLASIIVIILSARSQVNDRIQGMAVGADDYLTKPFSPLALIEKISTFLSRK